MKYYSQFKQWAEHKTVQNTLTVLIALALSILILLVLLLFRSQITMAAGIAKKAITDTFLISKVTPIPTIKPLMFPSTTPTDIPTNTPIPSQQTYQSNISDPIVQCNLYACGTVSMTNSQCHLSGCCVIGNQNIVMTDQNKCNQEQQAYAQSHQLPIQQNQSNTNNTKGQYDQIKQQEQSSNEQYLYNQCANNVSDQIKSCDNGCQSTLNQDNNICYSAYAAPNAYEGVSTDKYKQCLDEVTAKHQTCLSGCSANQTTDLQNCSTNAMKQSGISN